MDEACLEITVVPKSSQSKIVEKDNSFKAYLHSAPENNKANLELIVLLSKKIKIPKSNITIIKGDKSRNKKVQFENITMESILKKLRE